MAGVKISRGSPFSGLPPDKLDFRRRPAATGKAIAATSSFVASRFR